MSHPVLWPKKTYFYPIGNTPPVCLTQDLPLEQSANILLLGCGDPRNILYTLFAGTNLKSPAAKSRTLDFTCCDFEPAVLARNALLFTLIADGHPVDTIWNIFYHIRLDDSSLSLLIEQCEKLVSMSRDLDSWVASPYATFLRVCSRRTLSQLHDHWQLYALARTLLKGKHKSLFAEFIREFEAHHGENGVSVNFSASRSAGPFWLDTVEVLGSYFEQYWRTGTVFPNPEETASTPFVNPTFVYSLTGAGCAVHYGTYPLQCFHLASAFAESSSALSRKNIQYNELYSCARLQFQQWCDSFTRTLSLGSVDAVDTVTIRLFAGDAIALCRTFYHCRVTSSTSASLFVSAWAGAELVLDGGDYGLKASAAPTKFDVIETSNIADHVGLMNVLIAAVPIFSHRSSSTLYTETLLVKGADAVTDFVQRLCGEIPAVSLLFGIAPTAYVSNFTSHANIHELVSVHAFKSPQYYERIAWKTPYLGDSIVVRECGHNMLHSSWDPSELARLLFNIYYRLFADEDFVKNMQSLTITDSIIHYHRGTFAALLGLVKSRVDVDWDLVMEHIFQLLHADRKLIMGSNNYQELCCQLYIRGIYCVDALRPNRAIPGTDLSGGRFQGWKNVPPVICLVLVIPRRTVKVLEDMGADELGSPMLQCEVRSSTFHNIFSSIQVAFGSVSIQGSKCKARAVLNEDVAGWSGSSPLVVSFWIPSFNLAFDPPSTQIGLGVHSTPATAVSLSRKLGLQLNLFTANLMDLNSVHIVSERPHRIAELPDLHASMPHSPTAKFRRVSVALNGANISSLAARWHITDAGQLSNSPEAVQISPCTMKVTLGKISNNLAYPFPIDGARSKLRIARKSGWIEVIVPLSDPHSPSGYTTNNFPVLLSEDGQPTVWNVHRVNLERLPVINTQQSGKSSWICPHVSLALSDRERGLREQAQASGASPLVDVLTQIKDSLHCFFMRASEPNARRIFAFTAPSCGIYTIIFLNHLRLDLASNTLVADTCVLPLTLPRLEIFGEYVAGLTGNGKMILIDTSEKEARGWKCLIPVFVDRCRTWSHTPTCQYMQAGTVPLSIELDQNPICGCGEGKGLGVFPEVPGWKLLVPYVTRATFSPLFAVSYLEAVGGDLKARFDSRATMGGNDIGLACAYCKKAGKAQKLRKCSRCKETSYCGQVCQRADWKQHKRHCRA